MPLNPKILAPGDLKGAGELAFRDEMINLNNGYASFVWLGVAKVVAGVSAASLDIVRYSPQRAVVGGTWQNNLNFIVPANAYITRIGLKVPAGITLGAATGKLKVAFALTNAADSLFANSAAASGGVLAGGVTSGTDAFDLDLPGVSVGGSDVTYKLFATDGNATEGSVAASTVTTTGVDKRVLVRICGLYPVAFPPDVEFPDEPPLTTSNNYG